MQNPELDTFIAQHLCKIDYSIRELRQAYILAGMPDALLDQRMAFASEAIGDARDRLNAMRSSRADPHAP